MAIEVTPLNIEDIIKTTTTSLYVVNNTDRQRTRAKGVLHLVVKDESGEEVVFNVPNTWIPIDLANYCDVQSILKSTTFRAYIRSGILLAISSAEAREILNGSAAIEEAQLVSKRENEIANAVPLKVGSNNKVTIFGSGNNVTQVANSSDVVDQGPSINEDVKLLVADFNRGDDDEATSRRVLSIIGDRESWIWASENVKQTSSATYLAIADKLGEFA